MNAAQKITLKVYTAAKSPDTGHNTIQAAKTKGFGNMCKEQ